MTSQSSPGSTTHNRILLTFDGSEASRSAFQQATRLAKALNAEVLILRVYQVPPHIWVHPDADQRESELKRLQVTWDAEMKTVAQELAVTSGLTVTPLARTLGQRWTVTDEILAVADEFDPVLICMATRGESPIRQLLVGSIAMGVLSRSERPVVLAKSGER
jgi:nucleotide-binding universal stress UspA family protein